MNTRGIKSYDLGGILGTDEYLNAIENPKLEFFAENVQKTDGDYQFVTSGKMKTKSLGFKEASTQLMFNYNKEFGDG